MPKIEKKEHHFFRTLFFIIVLIVILIYIYATYVGNRGLIIKEYDIVSNKIPTSFSGTKIAHFADILYKKEEDIEFFDNIVEKINGKNVDIIIFSGDLIKDNYKLDENEIKKIIEKLKLLNSKYGKYYVSGKNDKKNQSYDDIMQKSGFISLNDSQDTIYNNRKEKIQIVGLNNGSEITVLKELTTDPNLYRIMVFHESDRFDDLETISFDLALSSNSLNGQINIPIIREFLLDEGSKEYNKPYYKIDNKELYITSGIGTKNTDLRLLNKPSINIYKLKN
ncbi:MAG: metallophosphoesterase [Bacilli bacterium]|nr:metallophosphoesterase [Bacilli bacterium]